MLKGICVPSKNIFNAKNAGFDYIELPGFEISAMTQNEFDKTCDDVKKSGINVMGFNAYCTEALPIAGEGFDKLKTVEYASLMCERGTALGIKNIGIGSPAARLLNGYDVSKAYENGKNFIKLTATVAMDYGLNVLIEALHRHCCDFINTLNEAYEFMNDINMPNVKMIIDFYHMKANGEDFNTASSYIQDVFDVHISGLSENYSRPFADEIPEEDLLAISSILKSAGYRHGVTLEPDNPKEGFSEKAKKSLEIMKTYF